MQNGRFRVVDRLTDFYRAVQTLFSRERLEGAPPPPPAQKESFFTWLTKPETLPRAAVSVAPPKVGFFTWLLLPEALPPPGEDGAGDSKPSLFSVLLAKEELPRDAEGEHLNKYPVRGRKQINKPKKGRDSR